ASNASMIGRTDQFVSLAGRELTSSYTRPTGFRSDFCSRCGSPVPNPLRTSSYVWVPAGLLDESSPLEVAVHLFVGSRASWEPMPVTGELHDEAPAFSEILRALRS